MCVCVCAHVWASLTEHFQLGTDRQVGVLHRADVDALVVMGDIRDLKPPVGEKVDSGICQKGRAAAAFPGKEAHACSQKHKLETWQAE